MAFKSHIAKCFELVDAKAGEKLNTNEYFYIILDGKVDIKTPFNGSNNEYTLVIGESFDVKHLKPLFRVRGSYLQGEHQRNIFVEQDLIATVSPTADAKLYRCCKRETKMHHKGCSLVLFMKHLKDSGSMVDPLFTTIFILEALYLILLKTLNSLHHI